MLCGHRVQWYFQESSLRSIWCIESGWYVSVLLGIFVFGVLSKWDLFWVWCCLLEPHSKWIAITSWLWVWDGSGSTVCKHFLVVDWAMLEVWKKWWSHAFWLMVIRVVQNSCEWVSTDWIAWLWYFSNHWSWNRSWHLSSSTWESTLWSSVSSSDTVLLDWPVDFDWWCCT